MVPRAPHRFHAGPLLSPHHGSHFVPAASRFLHGFLPWLNDGAPARPRPDGRQKKKTPGPAFAAAPGGSVGSTLPDRCYLDFAPSV